MLDPLARDILSQVDDPELEINIIDLGLVYSAEHKNNTVHIRMTLTTPACPYADTILANIESAFDEYETDVQIELVFDPAWNRSMISEHILIERGLV